MIQDPTSLERLAVGKPLHLHSETSSSFGLMAQRSLALSLLVSFSILLFAYAHDLTLHQTSFLESSRLFV